MSEVNFKELDRVMSEAGPHAAIVMLLHGYNKELREVVARIKRQADACLDLGVCKDISAMAEEVLNRTVLEGGDGE